jgi:DNA-binding NtrC family response regulator
VTLVFRGSGQGVEADKPEVPRKGSTARPREAVEQTVFLPDPTGFAVARNKFSEILATPRRDCFQRLIGAVQDALPDVEVAVLVPGGDGDAVALASVWAGNLPRLAPSVLGELRAPGRYAQVPYGAGVAAVVPVVTPAKDLVAVVAARPIGSLGSEGVGLLCEAARLLGMRWRDIGREGGSVGSGEKEAGQRLEAQVLGSSQAVQVLRAGMLGAAFGGDPVLICGGEGTGRTETARFLATIGTMQGRPVVVVDGQGLDDAGVRNLLFGTVGHPTLTGSAEGALGKARGGALILRNVDRLSLALQAELAGLISAQQRVPADGESLLWVVTCGEDPLALVQQGMLASTLFMLFSRRMLRVPRLAERREDLPLLIAGLLRQVSGEQGKSLRGITLECLNTLLAHSFPGEMAELVGEINRLVTATPDREMVRCENLTSGRPLVDGKGGDTVAGLSDVLASDSLKEVVPRVERMIIDRVMRRLKGNQSKSARTLGISRGALIAKLKDYEVPDYRFLRRRAAKN